MALIQTAPEDLPSTNALDYIDDPDAQQPEEGERAEIYLSGSHVCTLDKAPRNRERITMMVDLEVTAETVRANGDADVPVRTCKRIGDMYLPGTTRPPSKDELAAEAAREKARAAREKADQEEAERAEREHNEPPMFDEEGDPIAIDAPGGPTEDDDVANWEAVEDNESQGDDGDNVVQFSDKSKA